jgi:hypothetical protein
MIIKCLAMLMVLISMTMNVAAAQAQGLSQGGDWTGRISPDMNLAWASNRDLTSNTFSDKFKSYSDQGLMITDDTPNGTRYGAIWAENNPERRRYGRRGELDKAIQDYLDETSTKGISVAIIKDGDVLYRRGFGWAC